jgi:hypothetical protein
MAVIQHRQIADAIKTKYLEHVFTEDINTGSDDAREVHRLSRGLASLVLSYLAQIDPATSGKACTDEGQDNGIDAIYYDVNEKNLILVQTKWNTLHSGGVDTGGIHKFIKGVKDLLNSRKGVFGNKIINRWTEIETAINQARRVTVTIAYSGSASFSADCKRLLDDFVTELDETGEMISWQSINQSQLHSLIVDGEAGNVIATHLNIFEWGHTSEPLKAYYGQVAASDLVDLHKKYGERLFSKNIRFFLGNASEVNIGVQKTLAESPEYFWYLNNGITALASNITRRAIGGASRESGLFDCEGLTIVNGAQTVGSLSNAADKALDALKLARVPIRIIQLKDAPEGFGSIITRTNNTQNRIDSRNFVALDPEQERLRVEFALDKIDYEFRQGEIENQGTNRLGLVEATIALACTQSTPDLAVQAKREIGKLWDDITRAPYKTLFNRGRTSEEIWRRVLAFRRIDSAISLLEFQTAGKTSHVATHGNRLLAHIVYRDLMSTGVKDDLSNITDAKLKQCTLYALGEIAKILDSEYADNYVASLFKNLTKCRSISSAVNIVDYYKSI